MEIVVNFGRNEREMQEIAVNLVEMREKWRNAYKKGADRRLVEENSGGADGKIVEENSSLNLFWLFLITIL